MSYKIGVLGLDARECRFIQRRGIVTWWRQGSYITIIDYPKTFAPVEKLNTIRILISLAINFYWPLQKYDIKNDFLHGERKEDIYMNIPPRYEDSTTKGKVYKLKTTLYGLK